MGMMQLRIFGGAGMAAVLLAGTLAGAQAAAPFTNVRDSSPLKPPAGYRVAVVEWEDLECPDCARAFPVVKEITDRLHVPWVQHDFPLKFHIWSFDAAVDARFFDLKSKDIGNEFRGEVFAAQMYLHSKDDLKTFAQKFAGQHGIQWPFVVDPQGKLAADIKADYALGEKVGLDHTPTIFVVTNGRNSAQQFQEVTDRSRMDQMLQAAINQVGGVKDAAAPGKPVTRRKSGK
jgi:hypothetical protein